MTTTLPLRRSKRKQNEQAAALIPNTTKDIAPPPRKRARKANISPNTEPCIPKHEHAKVNQVITDTKPVRSQRYDTLPPFLALPRELRDEIYKHVLEQDESSTLKTGRGNNIVTRCGLVGVNNQISEEFLDAVLFHAHVITATVRNHNFAHVVTFLNRLSQAQLARLSTHGPTADEVDDDDRKPKRKIRIILSYSAGAKDSRVHLNRWLDRFDAPDKRGKEIEFEYHNDGTYRNGGYKQRPRLRGNASKRWNDEATKIGRGAARGRAWGGWGGYGGYVRRY
ncbi:hypothetical protein GGP41_003748 [Bipolaris sorokiniana]|uniref:F-box domain-containing protein n=2 Tax=Cochliobolus sativus TaxID=45130 RepID=A0A8H5ZBK9_COCSA|nr:uncharacterized protein COCSADRAFT_36449 [Bipolaris sorokiniana ND90Pr]EMD65108.1 hypothetical protein COCSADRAFT_36449 [Bipolaris sorokiniana ND90Pr]KAF5846297.1 hypothetical protein GGP41_003748 [Bipolaris sorokiniana]